MNIRKSTIFRYLLFLLFLIFSLNYAYSTVSTIKIDTLRVKSEKVPKTIFGVFVDFLNNFINGSDGLWAQELMNRGFDHEDYTYPGISYFWKMYGTLKDKDKIELLKGGYNENGTYFQRITNTNEKSELGIYQNVYVYDTVGGDFYVYLKGNTNNAKVKISLLDTLNNQIYFTETIEGIDTIWKKFEFNTTKIIGAHTVKLAIILEGKGILDIDEISFMASHNVMGIKKEYYDIFSRWQPGIIRYPGGYFADTKRNIWQKTIVDIDKRTSPNSILRIDDQRMDFGTNEYLKFCKSIGSEPHLVVNMVNANAQEAADWSDYCNGSTDTYYGKLRSDNGFPEPFGVKYWEIGNEQWENPVKTANDYLPFYHALKEKNPNYQIMVCGNTWGGKDYLKTVFDIIGDKTELYSYHDITPAKPQSKDYDERQRYYSIMGASKLHDNMFGYIKNWMKESNVSEKVKLALTEYLIIYDVKAPQWIDTSYRNASFETGIWMASVYNSFIRNSDFQPIFEKTFGLGHIRVGFDKMGKRIFYPSPIHTIMEFMRHHTGEYIIPVNVDSPWYSTELIEGLYQSSNVPMLDVTITANKDKLFISVVNKHISDSLETTFDFPFNIVGLNAKKFQLYEEDYTVFNTPDNPERIKITEKQITFANSYIFPPHSFTLFEIPVTLDFNISSVADRTGDFMIYPNPATENITIVLPKDLNDSIEAIIYNSQGAEVLKSNINSNDIISNINIQHLSMGMYYIIIKDKYNIYKSTFCKVK
jgi:alpha-N-arabinofuranosidase